MANVLAFFGILLVFALCYPALLLLIWHTQPAAARARDRLERMPRRCVALGFGVTLLIAIPLLALLSSASGAGQFAGWMLVLFTLGLSAIGASGLAALLGARVRPGAQSSVLIGALALALATFFPLLGWLIALPIALFAALGASVLALFARPRRAALAVPLTTPATAQ